MKINYDAIAEIMKDVTLYDDWNDRRVVYAEFPKPDGQMWLSSIDGNDFQGFLRLQYSAVVNTNDELQVAPVLRKIHDGSRYFGENKRVKVYYRLAGTLSTGIEYFLADKKQRAVQVSSNGMTVTTAKEHKFINRTGTLPQVKPVCGSKTIFELLQPYVNLKGDSFILFVIWLIQAFSGGSHYSLFLSADMGSGKSVLTYVISELLDPSPSGKCLMPSSTDDLETLLSSHYLCSFDNVSFIPKDFSDTFCVAVTGGTVSRRMKFSDSDMVYLPVHNVLVLNGIGLAPSESDLAERSLFFRLKKLASNELKSQTKLEDEFAADKPFILYEIFTTLSKAMQIFHELTPKSPPRMVDAYTEMLAIALALGIEEADFARMVAENTAAMDKARAVDPLIEAVGEAMDFHSKRKLEGTSTEIFNLIKTTYSGGKGLLPKTVSTFGKKLSQLEAPLKVAGYRILLDDTGARQNKITIIRAKD